MDIAAPGPTPPEGDLDRRVTALETDMREVKAGIVRLEVAAARTDARLAGLTDRVTSLEGSVDQLRTSTQASIDDLRTSTQASIDGLRASMQVSMDDLRKWTQTSLDGMRDLIRVSADETRKATQASNDALRASLEASQERLRTVIDTRMPTPFQSFSMVTGLITVFIALAGGAIAIGRYFGIIH